MILSENGPESGQGRCVAVALAQFMDSKTLETIAGIPRIARSSGFCERTVRTELHALRAGGWITERTKGRGHPVIRAASLPAHLADAATPAPHAAPPRHDMPEVTPVNGAGNPGTRLPDTPARHAAYLDQNLEKSLGAAPPSPAEAGSAARTDFERAVADLKGKGFDAEQITGFLRIRYGATRDQVDQALAAWRQLS